MTQSRQISGRGRHFRFYDEVLVGVGGIRLRQHSAMLQW
jgi:hypothetical protein